MGDNLMRSHLVTTFHCHECGSVLKLSYKPKDDKVRSGYHDDGITGAAKVENKIWIEPCRPCREPLDRLKEALRSIS